MTAPTAYHDRIRSPAETVALVRPHFEALGITRLARQTGLDRVGIPCFAAFRPNSRSIACNQGKGVDDDSARASAVMEALEYAVAEHPDAPVIRRPAHELAGDGATGFDPAAFLPMGAAFDPTRPLAWVEGTHLTDSGSVWAPLDLVSLNGQRPDLPSICQNTNGLASGNTETEAIFHGSCELVERDAATLWSLLTLEEKLARCVRPASLGDDLILAFIAQMEASGLALRLFDQTTDLGIPTVLAVCAPADGVIVRHFDVAAGAGTHPNPARAALRALTEAAQTRITSIAGARDDVRPDSYRLDGSAEALALVGARPQREMARPGPALRSAEALLRWSHERLSAGGIDDLVAVPLGGDAFGVSVVRMLSQTLEDRGPNAHWRPGGRALAALLGT